MTDRASLKPSFAIELRVITVMGVRKRPIRTREGKEEEEDKASALGCSEDDGFEEDLLVFRDYSFLSIGTDRTFEMYILMQLAI